ncbi:baseplate assembly protein [Pseudoalteromonas luteoviolacea CPMOR-1]|uniref:Baseplate assembly protein n=1 Tax=Pseudoalteromonas luteoviolacea CPMOR-1 TaxID=1365248 RepID=A0A162BXM4_9GAMM|nr:baseplate J/gp47 family protein [Pseudoalteromonas luteoviolacea]KZN57480.1 baseplate assembly protein [Pseudoalteromonas luteoviolacea CPMOR-1]
MSMTNFTGIDLSKLPPPNIIEPLSYEQIKNDMLTDYKARYPDAEITLASEPAVKLIEAFAYRELKMRQRVNEAAEAVLLAKAADTELDYLGARFGVERQIVEAGDPQALPPIPATYEDNERYRERIQLALEGFSTAGPIGAYVFHAMRVSSFVKDVAVDAPIFASAQLSNEQLALLPAGTTILQCTYDAGLANPQPGDVAISVLSTQSNGTPTTELNQSVLAHLNADDVRPLTDHVRLRPTEIIEYQIEAVLHFYPGPDAESVRQAAETAVQAWVIDNHKLGRDISLSALYSVLHRPGVQRVELLAPANDLVVNGHQAAFCTSVNISTGGRNV